jgi:hypothetical protein
VEETPRPLARIAVDLDTGNLAAVDASKKTRWWTPLRRRRPDFYAVFAAEGLWQLEVYLGKWAAYEDYLAQRPDPGRSDGHDPAFAGADRRPLGDVRISP